MSKEAKARAELVREMPHVKRWLADLEKLCRRMPREVWMFSNGSLSAMAADERGRAYVAPGGGMDPDAMLPGRYPGHWDGGDW